MTKRITIRTTNEGYQTTGRRKTFASHQDAFNAAWSDCDRTAPTSTRRRRPGRRSSFSTARPSANTSGPSRTRQTNTTTQQTKETRQ